MSESFTKECLDLYKELHYFKDTDRENFFDICVKERLNELLESNSNQIDYTIHQLSAYIDKLILETPAYERCSNYKWKNKYNMKNNMAIISRILKKYNKTCITASKLLSNLIREGNCNA